MTELKAPNSTRFETLGLLRVRLGLCRRDFNIANNIGVITLLVTRIHRLHGVAVGRTIDYVGICVCCARIELRTNSSVWAACGRKHGSIYVVASDIRRRALIP